MCIFTIIKALINSDNNSTTSIEDIELQKGNYESYNFEEEELEEDDYYGEDDE